MPIAIVTCANGNTPSPSPCNITMPSDPSIRMSWRSNGSCLSFAFHQLLSLNFKLEVVYMKGKRRSKHIVCIWQTSLAIDWHFTGILLNTKQKKACFSGISNLIKFCKLLDTKLLAKNLNFKLLSFNSVPFTNVRRNATKHSEMP